MIELTEKDFHYNSGSDVMEIDLTVDMNVTGEEFYTSIRKQILENQTSKRENSSLKEAIKTINKIVQMENNQVQKLTKENKQLKEQLGNCYNDEKRMGIDIANLKEIVEKIKVMRYHTEVLLRDNPENPKELTHVRNLFKELLATKNEL